MGAVIIILVIVLFFLLVSLKGKNGMIDTTAQTQDSRHMQWKDTPHESVVKIKVVPTYSSNREKRNKRDKRHKRQHRIWTVLHFMEAYDKLMYSQNFYDLTSNTNEYNDAKAQMRKEHITQEDIEVAVRFCRMECFYGTCDHPLSPQEVSDIQNWQNIAIDEEALLNNVLLAYEKYWNSVLNAYKRTYARKNRLSYLVINLDELMTSPQIQKYPTIITKMSELQSRYADELNKEG